MKGFVMNGMIKSPSRGVFIKFLLVTAFTVVLTACGGGSSTSLPQQIQNLIATGTATNLEAAIDLLLANQDNLSAADFEALMDALTAA
jgi:formyltetrahydrofolate synthetase